MSLPFSFDKADVLHTLKVCGYSLGATVVASLIVIVGKFQVNPEYLFLVPIANTLLVGLENYLTDKTKE